MRGFEKLDHLVNNHVLETFTRFFSEFRVKSDAARDQAAATPFGFHMLQKTLSSFICMIDSHFAMRVEWRA